MEQQERPVRPLHQVRQWGRPLSRLQVDMQNENSIKSIFFSANLRKKKIFVCPSILFLGASRDTDLLSRTTSTPPCATWCCTTPSTASRNTTTNWRRPSRTPWGPRPPPSTSRPTSPQTPSEADLHQLDFRICPIGLSDLSNFPSSIGSSLSLVMNAV